MKTQIRFLSFLAMVGMIALVFSSCAKEEIIPLSVADETLAISSNDGQEETFDDFADTGNSIDADFNSLTNAMASLEFVKYPDWDVSIKNYTCFNDSETLLVYNADRHNLDFYNSERFQVLWFKNGKPIRGSNRLECVCRGEYAVIVILKATKKAIGIAFFNNVQNCKAIEAPNTTGHN